MSFSCENPVAVLVDAENLDAADARPAIAALSAKFSPLILHAFGDFRRPGLRGWCDILDAYGGQAMQVTPTPGYDNSAHICLTMNAMEILSGARASAICIFCGTGDFSQLAVRVRKAGLPVFGFGNEICGSGIAHWFDSWQVIGGDEAVDEIDENPEQADVCGQEEEPDQQTAGELEDDESVVVSDVEADKAVEAPWARPNIWENAGDQAGDDTQSGGTGLQDCDVMAEIEGKRKSEQPAIVRSPPISDERLGSHLTDDAMLLLSTFISNNLNGNGYALLSDVANAATATDILVPPEEKSAPDAYLRQLVADDARFEITTLKTGSDEPEFIRRV